MKFNKIIFILAIILCGSIFIFGQKTAPTTQAVSNPIKSTPAYAELLLRRVELESELESLLVSYKEDFPKVKSTKYELALTQTDLQKLLAQTDAAKLTLALGKLLVRKNEVQTDYWALQARYGDEHPDVKRAKRKVLSFETAIKEILG